MARAKNYVSALQSSQAADTSLHIDMPPRRSTVVTFPDSPALRREMDFAEFLGFGADDWVWSCIELFETLLDSDEIQASTVNSYASRGFCLWMEFLRQLPKPQRSMESLCATHFARYCAWLALRGLKPTGARVAYYNTKGVLCELMDRGRLPDHLMEHLPKNPFPGAGNSRTPTKSLSALEFERLAAGVKAEVVAAHRDGYVGSGAQRVAVHYLIVSMRCGGNTTPLLELNRSSLSPHPILPNVMMLKIQKRRGNSTRLVPFRFSRVEKGTLTIPMDAVGVLRRAIELTDGLARECSKNLRDRVWLYRSSAGPTKGQITCLTQDTLLDALKAIVRRRDIRGDDGKPLRLTPRRIRKTVESRLWRISGGDLEAVAREMGQSPEVADTHYLELDAELLQEAATFVGAIFDKSQRKPKVISVLPERTPVSRCQDSLNGERAPKNGISRCSDFINCFGCASFAVVKEEEDLYRLLSFSSYLEAELRCYVGSEWAKWRGHREMVMRGIELFVQKHFPLTVLEKVKRRVQEALHPYWAARVRALGEVG